MQRLLDCIYTNPDHISKTWKSLSEILVLVYSTKENYLEMPCVSWQTGNAYLGALPRRRRQACLS